MIYEWRLQNEEQTHFLPRGTELLNLESAFLNLKSRGAFPYAWVADGIFGESPV